MTDDPQLPLFDGNILAANDPFYRPRGYYLQHASKYQTLEYRRVRREAFILARWRCERCWKRKRDGVTLEAHHIDPVAEYPELFFVLSNIMILCSQCHGTETKKQALKYGWRYAMR